MGIDFTKPIQTRDGRKVRIFATDAEGEQPIVGQVVGTDSVERWKENGQWMRDRHESQKDLVNVPEERGFWCNIYPNSVTMNSTKESADKVSSFDRIACVHVRYKVGEGL